MSPREQGESLGAGDSVRWVPVFLQLEGSSAACSASVPKAGSWTDGLTPQCAFLLLRVSTVHLVWTEEISDVAHFCQVLLGGPMSCILGDSPQGPAGLRQ